MDENYEPRTLSNADPLGDFIFESRISFPLRPGTREIPDSGFSLWDYFKGEHANDPVRSSGYLFNDAANPGHAILVLRTGGPNKDFSIMKQAHLMHANAFVSVFRDSHGAAALLPEFE